MSAFDTSRLELQVFGLQIGASSVGSARIFRTVTCDMASRATIGPTMALMPALASNVGISMRLI